MTELKDIFQSKREQREFERIQRVNECYQLIETVGAINHPGLMELYEEVINGRDIRSFRAGLRILAHTVDYPRNINAKPAIYYVRDSSPLARNKSHRPYKIFLTEK